MSLRFAIVVLFFGLSCSLLALLDSYKKHPITKLEDLVAFSDVESVQVELGEGGDSIIGTSYVLARNAEDNAWWVSWDDRRAKLSTTKLRELEALWIMSLIQPALDNKSGLIEVKDSFAARISIRDKMGLQTLHFMDFSKLLGAWHGILESDRHAKQAIVSAGLVYDFFTKDPGRLIENSALCGLALDDIDHFAMVWNLRGEDDFTLTKVAGRWIHSNGVPIDSVQVEGVFKLLGQAHKIDIKQGAGKDGVVKSEVDLFQMTVAAGQSEACTIRGERVGREVSGNYEEVFRFQRVGESVSWLFDKGFSLDILRMLNLMDATPLRSDFVELQGVSVQKGTDSFGLFMQEGVWKLNEVPIDQVFFKGWLTNVGSLESIGYHQSVRYVTGDSIGKLTLHYPNRKETFTLRDGIMLQDDLGSSEVRVVECDRPTCPFLITPSSVKRLLPSRDVFLAANHQNK